ncbi:MAG: carboxymuconolactone decarboxylase family protein [Deltaproteobacteria bacterium]|nr:carboxymuconolactone decarboxylase family protein [Deltaproteobacteria bacterium]
MRIKPKDYLQYPWYLKPFFWKQFRTYGQLLKPALLWAREPKLFAAVASLYGVLDRKSSPISPVLRSLVTVRVSQINWCRFCVDINSSVLAKRAGSMDKVDALEAWRQSGLFSEQERSVLEYVEGMTDTNRQVTDKMVEDLKKWFTEDGIVELTGLIAFQNLSSKFNSALDMPPQGFCQLPSRGD